MKKVIVAGASGLIGGHLVEELAARADVEVVTLVRTPHEKGKQSSSFANVRQEIFDFSDAASYARIGTDIPCDVLYCCLGTTLKKAGSPDAFKRVDGDYPLALLNQLIKNKATPGSVFAFVSSVGADVPRGLYLETKASVEKAIKESGVRALIVRPSLLLGNRQEFRAGERLGEALALPTFNLLAALGAGKFAWHAKYAPIEAKAVARALIRGTLDEPLAQAQLKVLEGHLLREIPFEL